MPELGAEQFNRPASKPRAAYSRLWREWCFARIAFRHFRIKFLLIGGLLLGGGVLFRLFEPDKHHSYPRAVYYTWVLVFGQPPEDFPASPILQAMFFIVPLLGLLVILEVLVEFALILRDRRRYERSWCKVMAASLSNHIILVGLGKLGYRTYRLLRRLGEEVVVIEHNADNQFLEDIRRDGSPLFVGDARREAFLEDANAAAAKSIILATNHDMVNLEVALDARRINPRIRVVMRMFDPNIADKVREGFNIQVAMSQSALSAPAFVTAALDGCTVSSLTIGDQLMVIERWRVEDGGPLQGRAVGQIMADHGVIIVERRTAGEEPRLIPPPDTCLKTGDELLIQGTFQTLSNLRGKAAPAFAGRAPRGTEHMNLPLVRSTWAMPMLLGLCLLLNSACECPPALLSPAPTHLISMDSVWTLTPEQVAQAHAQLVESQFAAGTGTTVDDPLYAEWFNLARTILVDSVDCRKITYWSRNADGQAIRLTGMLYLPRRLAPVPIPARVSLIAYPHGTELLKDNVPSNNAGDEWIFGAAGALFAGFAVAMPDLPGMGGADPQAYHPYCHAQSLAYSVIDMIQAVKEGFGTRLCTQYWWDGNLYILGYSEGGYAAMATVKELQLNASLYPGLAITGSACLAGPFDLTGAMRDLMVNSTLPFGAPYFLPYVILGYSSVYAGPFDPSQTLKAVLLPDILQWMNGVSFPSDEVNRLISERLGLPEGQSPAPRDMLDPTWISQQLADDVYQTSQVGQILAANNLWSGWAPNRPMLLRQSPDDDRVPYANTEKAFTEFAKAGAIDQLTFLPIGKAGDGIGHVTGAIIGLPSAIIWFRNGCPHN